MTTQTVDDILDQAVDAAKAENTETKTATQLIDDAFAPTGSTPTGGGLAVAGVVQPVAAVQAGSVLSLDDLDALDSSFVPDFWIMPSDKGAVLVGERSISDPIIVTLQAYRAGSTIRLHHAMKYGSDEDPKTIRSYDGVMCNTGEYAGQPWQSAVMMAKQVSPDKAPYAAASIMFQAAHPIKAKGAQAEISAGTNLGHITSKTTFTNSAKALISKILQLLKNGEISEGDNVYVEISSKDQSFNNKSWSILTMKYLGVEGSPAVAALDLNTAV